MSHSPGGAAPGKRWPYCEFLQAQCLAYVAAQRLGVQPFATLLDFIATAESGARLILQRNSTEFTVQITGAIQRGQGSQLTPEELRRLRDVLSRPEGEAGR